MNADHRNSETISVRNFRGGWSLVSADSLNVDRSSSGVNTVVHAVNNPNNARGLIGFPVKNINRKKQEAKPTGGRPFNSNESITCALALCTLVGGQTNLSRSITVIIVGMLGMT